MCLSDQQTTIHQALEHDHALHARRKTVHASRDSPVMPLPTPLEALDDPGLRIKLIDFGHGMSDIRSCDRSDYMYVLNRSYVAQKTTEHLTNQIQAPSLRAPEVILGYEWSTGVDIWSLGCIVSFNHQSSRLLYLRFYSHFVCSYSSSSPDTGFSSQRRQGPGQKKISTCKEWLSTREIYSPRTSSVNHLVEMTISMNTVSS